MTLKPWLEIARPHRDVLQGTFKLIAWSAIVAASHESGHLHAQGALGL